MSVAHGTPGGFEAGCRTAASCVNHGSVELMTCVEANTRSKWDRGYLRRVEAGDLSALREEFEGEGFAKWRPVARRVWVEESFEVEPVRESSTFERVVPVVPDEFVKPDGEPWRRASLEDYVPGVLPEVKRPEPVKPLTPKELVEEPVRRKPGRPKTPVRHGTKAGYIRGCHKADEAVCPAKLAGGMSCAEAEREYHRGLVRRGRPAGEVSAADRFEDVARELDVARSQLAVAVAAVAAIRMRLEALVAELFRDAS